MTKKATMSQARIQRAKNKNSGYVTKTRGCEQNSNFLCISAGTLWEKL